MNRWLSKSSGPNQEDAQKRNPVAGLFGPKGQTRPPAASSINGASRSDQPPSSRMMMMKHLFPDSSEDLLKRALAETSTVAQACEYVKSQNKLGSTGSNNVPTDSSSSLNRKATQKSKLLDHVYENDASPKKNLPVDDSSSTQRRALFIGGLPPKDKAPQDRKAIVEASKPKLKPVVNLSDSEGDDFEQRFASFSKKSDTASSTTTKKSSAEEQKQNFKKAENEEKKKSPIESVSPKQNQTKRVAAESPSPVVLPRNGKVKRSRVILPSDSESDSDVQLTMFERDAKPDNGKLALKSKEDDEEDDEDAGTISREVIECLNSASFGELVEIGRFKKVKAEILITMRPFSVSTFADSLREMNAIATASGSNSESRNNSSLLSIEEIDSRCRRVMSTRSRLTAVMAKCNEVAASLQMQTNSSSNAQNRSPSLLTNKQPLKSYQLAGVSWLYGMHKSIASGAILGDEMGLGKTIQTIALLAYLLEHELEQNWSPHLIIVPSSTLANWQHEIATWCPSLRPTVYHGPMEERRHLARRLLSKRKSEKAFSAGSDDQDLVILTTYAIACGKSREDRALLRKLQFNYVICDEGHLLKNMESKRYTSLCRISSRKRLLLTGTPMQNSLIELVSLLTFLEPTIFAEHVETFSIFFRAQRCNALTSTGNCADQRDAASSGDGSTGFESERIAHAQRLLKPFILRRRKVDVLVDLPSKRTIVESVHLTSRQSALYASLRHAYIVEQSNSSGSSSRTSPLTIITQLRKVAQSALLVRSLYTDDLLPTIVPRIARAPTYADLTRDELLDELSAMCDYEIHRLCVNYAPEHKLSDQELFENSSGKFLWLRSFLKQSDERILIFSQFLLILDLLEAFLDSIDIPYVRLDGQTPVTERRALIDAFNCVPASNDDDQVDGVDADDESGSENDDSFAIENNKKPVRIFLLSTKAGGLGINLTTASTVILHDLDFNPYNDRQAEDRSHRLGQTRDVSVYRLLATGTIDDAMQAIQNQKLQLDAEMQQSNSSSNKDDTFVSSQPKPANADADGDNDDDDDQSDENLPKATVADSDVVSTLNANEAIDVVRMALGL